jgi:Tfp pilus assembly protein PilN
VNEINFFPWRQEQRQIIKRKLQQNLLATLLSAFLVLVGWHFILCQQTHSAKDRYQSLMQQLAVSGEQAGKLKNNTDLLVNVATSDITALTAARERWIQGWNLLNRNWPEDLYLLQLTFQEGEFKLQGRTETIMALSKLLCQLSLAQTKLGTSLQEIKWQDGGYNFAITFVIPV